MRAAIVAALLLVLAPSAQALTIRDVIELTRAGLTDEVLIALIEVDSGVFATDTATLKSLKEAGVSERVMVALIRSGRDRRVEETLPPVEETGAQAPAPQVVVIEHREVIEHRQAPVQQVAVPVPVYVPVYPSRSRHRGDVRNATVENTYVPFQSGLPVVQPRQEPQAPVYWGFGGKLRPDAWGQPRPSEKKPSRDEDTDRPKKK